MSKLCKALCLILVLVMCLGVFAGCNNTPANNDPKDTDDGTATTAGDENGGDDDTTAGDDDSTATENPKERNDLDPEYIFEGKTQEFIILTRATTAYEFESPTGELAGVEQAIFDRNAEVAERCHIELSIVPQAGTWDDRDSFIATLRTNSLLPVSQYDLVSTHQSYLATATLEGYGWDFTKLDNIDVNKAWWSEVYYNECNYNGAIYMMYGDIAYTLYEYLQVFFFNEQVAEDLAIEDLYDLAINGDWTFAKLQEYTKMATTNLDLAEEDREYGLLTGAHANRAFGTSFYCELAPADAEGIRAFHNPGLSTDVAERMQAVVDFVVETPQVLCDMTYTTAADVLNPVFAAGRSLFYAQMLGQASYFTENMKDAYGVLPYPKYNDDQAKYRTEVCDEVSAVMAPRNCKLPTMTGTVSEMMSMISYFDVITIYYGEKLQYQYFNNPKCVQSLNIIRDTFAPSFTMVYSYPLEFPNSLMSGTISSSTPGIASDIGTAYRSKVGTFRRKLRDLYLDLDKLAEADAQ